MKLGLLPFAAGVTPASQQLLADILEAASHAIVLAEKPASSNVAASDEAARLARADCDGVALCLFTGQGAGALEAVPGRVVQAALHAACPVLLLGDDLPALLAASGALEEIGVTAGRAFGSPHDPATAARIQTWAALHDPTERRRGQDAAGKLFGTRYALLGDPSLPGGDVFALDASRWLTQFGVFVEYASARALAGCSIADYCADAGIAFCSLGVTSDGVALAPLADPRIVVLPAACGANGALTAQLIALVAGGDDAAAAVSTVALTGLPNDLRVQTVAGNVPTATPLTFARITRRLGRFVCLLVTGNIEDATLRPDCGAETLLSAAASPYLHAAPGDLRAALKAACETLDVEPILLV